MPNKTPCKKCDKRSKCKYPCKKIQAIIRNPHRKEEKMIYNKPDIMNKGYYYDDIHHKYKTDRDGNIHSVHFQDGSVIRGTFIKKTIIEAYKKFYKNRKGYITRGRT